MLMSYTSSFNCYTTALVPNSISEAVLGQHSNTAVEDGSEAHTPWVSECLLTSQLHSQPQLPVNANPEDKRSESQAPDFRSQQMEDLSVQQ